MFLYGGLMNNPSHIFRMKHYKNMRKFCDDGYLYAINDREQLQWSISQGNINSRRGDATYYFDGTATPHDYIPFYFSPITDMKYSILNGKVDLKNPQGEIVTIGQSFYHDIIFMVMKISNVLRLYPSYRFTNQACNQARGNLVGFQSFCNWNEDSDKINWGLFNDKYNDSDIRATIPEVEYLGVNRFCNSVDVKPKWARRGHIRKAEFLIKDKVDLNHVECLVVSNTQIRDTVVRNLTENGYNIDVYIKEDFYRY
jgi:hypothetical protein